MGVPGEQDHLGQAQGFPGEVGGGERPAQSLGGGGGGGKELEQEDDEPDHDKNSHSEYADAVNLATGVLENFLVLEGLDGAGTTTQLRLAGEELTRRGVPHFVTAEPTEGWIGRRIRAVLRGEESVQPLTMAMLYAADRSEHLFDPSDGILVHLRRGELVVCDRYLFSSLAYQGVLVDFEYVAALNGQFPLPRHLVFLDTPLEVSQDRLAGRGPAEIYDGAEMQRRVLREGYGRVLERFQGGAMSIHHLDGSGPPEQVFRQLWSILQTLPIVKG